MVGDSLLEKSIIGMSIIIIIFTTGFFLVRRWLQNLDGNHTAKVDEEGVEAAPECAVCLSQVYPAEIFQLLPHCKHGFHAHCIDTWLKYQPTCPLCRKRAVTLLSQNHDHNDNGVFGYVFKSVCNWIEGLGNYQIVPNTVIEFLFFLKS